MDEGIPVFNESTALLSIIDQDVVEGRVLKPPGMTPIPKIQLVTLCLVRSIRPVSFAQSFPYIDKMVVNLNLIEDPPRSALSADWWWVIYCDNI